MKTTGLFRPLALLALFACSPLEPACGGITLNRGEEIGEPDAPTEISIVQVAGPFEFPWSIAFLPDGSTLVTERVGRLQLVQHGMAPSEIAGIPSILNDDQAGLLDVAVDPAFAENRTVYLSYVHGTTGSSAVRVLKARLDQASLRLTEHQVIFESAPATITKLFGGQSLSPTTAISFSRWESVGSPNARRICRRMRARLFAFVLMVLFHKTIHLSQYLVRNRKSGLMAIAIRKDSRSMLVPTSCGHMSMGH